MFISTRWFFSMFLLFMFDDELKIHACQICHPIHPFIIPKKISGNACSSGAADAGEVRNVAGNSANPMHLKKHLG